MVEVPSKVKDTVLVPVNQVFVDQFGRNYYIDQYGQKWHWVDGSRRQCGYWRRVPYTYKHPSLCQREVRAVFSVTAHTKGMGERGTATDPETGKTIPASALGMKENMKGYQPINPYRREHKYVMVAVPQIIKLTLENLAERLERSLESLKKVS